MPFSNAKVHCAGIYMQQLFGEHTVEFDNLATLKELYVYVNKYYGDIVSNLDESPAARKTGLGHKMKSIVLSVYPVPSTSKHLLNRDVENIFKM